MENAKAAANIPSKFLRNFAIRKDICHLIETTGLLVFLPFEKKSGLLPVHTEPIDWFTAPIDWFTAPID